MKTLEAQQKLKTLEAFKAFCKKNTGNEALEDENWYSLSVGFFMASGLPDDEVYDLAREARYTHQYWIK